MYTISLFHTKFSHRKQCTCVGKSNHSRNINEQTQLISLVFSTQIYNSLHQLVNLRTILYHTIVSLISLPDTLLMKRRLIAYFFNSNVPNLHTKIPISDAQATWVPSNCSRGRNVCVWAAMVLGDVSVLMHCDSALFFRSQT